MRRSTMSRMRAATSSRRLPPEGHRHAPLGAELVGEHGVVGARDVGEEQRRAAGFDDPIGDLADLEVGIDARADLGEFARAPQRRDELSEGIECHAYPVLDDACRPPPRGL